MYIVEIVCNKYLQVFNLWVTRNLFVWKVEVADRVQVPVESIAFTFMQLPLEKV